VDTAASRAQAAAGGAAPGSGTAAGGVSAAAGRKGFKAGLDDLRERMRRLGLGYDEIAAEIGRRHRVRPRESSRLALGWTLNHAAERYNALAAREGADPQARAGMTGAHLCEHERWPDGGRKPSVFMLATLARMYETDVLRLLDLADHENLDPRDRLMLARPPQRWPAAPPASTGGQADEGLSLSLPFVPGRLLIEVSGPAAAAGASPERRAGGQLALVRDAGRPHIAAATPGDAS
jgi:hypothetical protein